MAQFDFSDLFDPKDYLYFYEWKLTDDALREEIDFLVKYTDLTAPMKILDLGCGHGRHANALVRLGHRVTGVDLMPSFLEIAKKGGEDVEYVQGDMRQLEYVDEFDRVYALFTVMGYFEDEVNADVFRRIYRALKPGGLFCFDSHNRDTFLKFFKGSHKVERGEDFLFDEHTYDTLTGRCYTKRTTQRDGHKKTFHFHVRFYNATEIITLFKQIGFRSIQFYRNWQGDPLDNDSKRFIVVAQK